jgi:hypothetical protein
VAAPVYIDDSYVANAIGAARRDAIVPTGPERTQIYQAATSLVRKRIRNAGYSPPSEAEIATLDLDGPTIRMVTLGVALPMMYGRVGAELPPQFYEVLGPAARQFLEGEIELEELQADSFDGIGGSDTKAPVVAGGTATDADETPVFAQLGRFV